MLETGYWILMLTILVSCALYLFGSCDLVLGSCLINDAR